MVSIDELDEPQRRALVVLCFHMMVADHEAVAPEKKLVDEIEERLGLTGTLVPAEFFAHPDLSVFGTADVRLLVLGRLACVAMADGRKHANEVEFLVRLAERFEIDGQTVARVVAWASLPPLMRKPLAEHLSA